MNFKEMIASDTGAIFLNPNEFGEIHQINGKDACIVFDAETLEQHNMAQMGGKSAGSDIMFYIDADFFEGHTPRSGKLMNFNGKDYRISAANLNMGLLSIKLFRQEE